MAEYEELIEALRHCYEDDDACATCQRWLAHDEWGIKCKGRLISDAAAAIEALQAQLPKQGEWITHQEVKNIYGGVYIECPFCGEKYVVQNVSDEKFCRNCGADLRAKMEVQE